MNRNSQRGQSLIELLIGITLGILLIGGAIGIIVLSLRIGSQNKFSQTGAELTHEYADQVTTDSDASWHNIFDAGNHDGTTPYHLEIAGNFFTLSEGSETVMVDGQQYTRYFTIADVARDGDSNIVTEGGTTDPSTLKVTFHTEWDINGETSESIQERYIARNKGRVFVQTDWSSGGGQEGPITEVNNRFSSSTNINYASTTGSIKIASFSTSTQSSSTDISVTLRYAWNDVIGWVDFYSTETVTVTSTGLTGYASSAIGYIALDCATAPTPDCTYPYQVANDGTGVLSGWAWSDTIGWISFSGNTGGVSWGVTIDQITGDFLGWAWNDIVGWFSFSCENTGSCGTVEYKVQQVIGSENIYSGELYSSTFDTEISGGAAFNTIMWQGSLPADTSVRFQIATSNNSGGPWNYYGPDGTDSTYYEPAGPDVQVKIRRSAHNNHRYVRYYVVLESNDPPSTPEVDDIIIGWSP